MKRGALLTLLALSGAPLALSAQRPPDTVFLEALTWNEIRDAIASGKTTAIIASAGTEQKGPHMVMGEHKFVLEYTTDRIARELGNALVAPIITYVPEGNLDPPSGHMRMAGTISVPVEVFSEMLYQAGLSLEAGGFTDIVFLYDSGGNAEGTNQAAERLNAAWAGTGSRAHVISDYYAKSSDDTEAYITGTLGVPAEDIGGHAGMTDTSQMMFVNAAHVRLDERANRGGFEGSGVSGDPTKATAELGEVILGFKIENALAQIRQSLAAREEER